MALFSRTPRELELTISARTFLKVVLLVGATMLLISFFRSTTYALTLLMLAFLLALSLNAPVSWLALQLPGRLKHSRSLGTTVVFLILAVVLTIFFLNVVPPLVKQTQTIIAHAPGTVQDLRRQYRTVNELVVRYHLQAQLDQLSTEAASRARAVTSSAFGAVTGFVGSLLSVFSVAVLTFMMVVEGPFWVNLFDQLVPVSQRKHIRGLRTNMYKAVRGYINGQVILALIASILILPGLLIFHVSYPFALMAVVFLCGLIPMVGHTIGAIIVTFIALFHSPLSALGILIYYFAYQQLENYLVQPRLQASVTNLSPLLVFIALIVGVDYGGLVGGFVGIPLVACLRLLVVDYLERHYDIDESAMPGATLKREEAKAIDVSAP